MSDTRYTLPADLPEAWTRGQVVAPDGVAVGLSEQHGYNYLMQQVNQTQQLVNEQGAVIAQLRAELAGKSDVGALEKYDLAIRAGFQGLPDPYENYYTKDATNRVQVFFSVQGSPLEKLASIPIATLPVGFHPQSVLHAAGYSTVPGRSNMVPMGIFVTPAGNLGVHYEDAIQPTDSIRVVGSIYFTAVPQ